MTGTALAQAIPIAISPILTRLYSPEEFGVFALYMAVASIASIFVTGRYELAILLPKDDSDAIQIVALAAGLSCGLSFVLLVAVVVLNQKITHWLGASGLSMWLYWVPASTLLMGLYQSLNYWNNRKSYYRRLAISRVVQSGSASIGQLSGGYAAAGAVGLVGGQIFGQFLSTATLARLMWNEDRQQIKNIKRNLIATAAKVYSNFPKYLVAAHGFNTASSQMPIMMITALFSTTITGFYTLTQRVLGAPMSLVAGAIGDVFRQEASYAYVHTGNCKSIYRSTFRRLLSISFLPFLVFFFLAPNLFSFVFGAKWAVAGEYAQILTPMFFLRFITSPISQVAVIAQKQKIDLIWQLTLLVLVVTVFVVSGSRGDIKVTLIWFSAVYSVMYIIAGMINYYLACGLRNIEAQ